MNKAQKCTPEMRNSRSRFISDRERFAQFGVSEATAAQFGVGFDFSDPDSGLHIPLFGIERELVGFEICRLSFASALYETCTIGMRSLDDVVFNYTRAIAEFDTGPLIVTETAMETIQLYEAGRRRVISTMRPGVSERQMLRIKELTGARCLLPGAGCDSIGARLKRLDARAVLF